MCKCDQKRCCKVISLSFILFAFVIGILANINDQRNINQRIVTSIILFFDAMIPILGSAALIKFLFTFPGKENVITDKNCKSNIE